MSRHAHIRNDPDRRTMSSVAQLALAVFTALWCASEGAFIPPTAYTLTGVMAVNGSSANGGCPSPCVGVASGITTCDCGIHTTKFGEEHTTGLLIDGSIPTINTTERNPVGTEFAWAAQLFTVRGSTDTVTLGFRFPASVLHEVELYLFHCPAWGIGAESIVIHNGASFPQFIRVFVDSIGSVPLTSDMQNCTSLTRVSTPLQMARSTTSYFIEFTNPSGDLIEWLHIAEVRFSDQPIATTMETTTEGTTTSESMLISTMEAMETTEPTAEGTTTSESMSTSTTEATMSMSTTEATVLTSTTEATIMTDSPPPPVTTVTNASTTVIAAQTTPGHNETLTSDTASQSSIPVAVVGAVVGVIVALVIIILILVVVVAVGCIIGRKKRSYRTEVEHLQDVVLERSTTNGTDKTSVKLNSLEAKADNQNSYQKTQFYIKERSQSSPPRAIAPPEKVAITAGGVHYSKLESGGRAMIQKGSADPAQHETSPGTDEAGYSHVVILSSSPNSDAYDDVVGTESSDGQYATVDNSTRKRPAKSGSQVQETDSFVDSPQPREVAYSLVLKNGPPLVPTKTPELYRDLKREGEMGKQQGAEEVSHYAEVGENPKKSALASVAQAASDPNSLNDEKPAYYSTIKEGPSTTTPSGGAPLGDFSELEAEGDSMKPEDVYSEVDNHPGKKRAVNETPVVGSAATDDMESNSMYDSADILIKPTGADVQYDDDIIYTNPDAPLSNTSADIYDVVYSEPIKPSMFVKSPERTKGTTADRFSESTEQEEEETEAVYAPIYSLTASMSSSNLLQVKHENIHKIKTLGTGFFGKVLLADTVGLSPKDLNLSETDDDKTKSVRVAIKTLRANPSPQRREVFEKELKFMSRLYHPNVVRTLGACTMDSPFIMMEYMEKGDLNQYLQNFESITGGNAPPTNLTISTGTLTYMSAQIADAMKYLASKNYIHRDLATRNCLVGDESRIKIADFGMSKNLYESHYYILQGHAILPVRWMARECFYGRFSAKTDVWAFGVTMWEIFTLAKDIPYEDMDDSEVVTDGSKLNADRTLLERPKDCPEDMYAVMLMSWAREPEDRATFDKLHETLLTIKPKD